MSYFLFYIVFSALVVYYAFKDRVMADPRAKGLKPIHLFVGCLMTAWISLPVGIVKKVFKN